MANRMCMIDHFFDYMNNGDLARIDNSHLSFADKDITYANSKNGLQLAQVHGQVVDFAKRGINPDLTRNVKLAAEYPDHMQKD